MRVFDAIVSLLGRLIVASLSITALIALVTVFIVYFEGESACKEASLDPVPPVATTTVPHESELASNAGYTLPEQTSPLAFPRWYISYSAHEYAQYLKDGNAPTHFRFGYATTQYWCSYNLLTRYAERNYPPDTGALIHLMISGGMFSAENFTRAVYEQSFGRASSWDGVDTPEDTIERQEAQMYAESLETKSWFEYPFFASLSRLWWDAPFVGPHIVRKWERKIGLSIGYGLKGSYAFIVKEFTRFTGKPKSETIMILVQGPLSNTLISDPDIKISRDFGDGMLILEIPRNERFTNIMKEFSHDAIPILDIAGGKTIVVSANAPVVWDYTLPGRMYFSQPLTLEPGRKRIIVLVPTTQLLEVLRGFELQGIHLEHVYEY